MQVIHEFGDPALLAELEPRVGVDLTLHEEIALEFAAITAPLDEVVAWVVEHVDVRPGLGELAELRPDHRLGRLPRADRACARREGIGLEVLANRVEARPDGWRVQWRDEARVRELRRAVQARAASPESRTSTSATATRIAALRSRPSGSSRGTVSPPTSSVRGFPYEPFRDFHDLRARL